MQAAVYDCHIDSNRPLTQSEFVNDQGVLLGRIPPSDFLVKTSPNVDVTDAFRAHRGRL